MRAVTSAEIAAIDRRATEEHGIPVAALMEAAGRAVAQVAVEMLEGRGEPVVVLAGKGHNGGDGLVAARHLAAQGIPVTALLAAPEAELQGEVARALREAKAAGVEVSAPRTADEAAAALTGAVLIIDALFGTGFRGPARGLAAEMIEAVGRLQRTRPAVLSVDVPSGLNADTGRAEGAAIRATATVTMGLPKVGLLTYPGADLAGRLYVADIGYPPALAEDPAVRTHLVMAAMAREAIPPRPPDSHKGTYGRVLIVGGSVGYTGAPVMAALGALRSGAGLVTVAVPQAVYPIVAAHLVEAMPRPLPEAGGAVAAEAEAAVGELAAAADVVAVGPGLSTAPGVRAVVEAALRSGKPVVVDADGLNVLAGRPEALQKARAPVVITPHPGELARLLGVPTGEIVSDRLGAARSTAGRLGCVVVLKSASTVVASPDGEAFINRTGNPGMATGGMGDVLTGAIASLIGQGLPPATAAWTAVYLHGLAADLLAEERAMAGMLATEVAARLPAAIARVLAGTAPERIAVLRP